MTSLLEQCSRASLGSRARMRHLLAAVSAGFIVVCAWAVYQTMQLRDVREQTHLFTSEWTPDIAALWRPFIDSDRPDIAIDWHTHAGGIAGLGLLSRSLGEHTRCDSSVQGAGRNSAGAACHERSDHERLCQSRGRAGCIYAGPDSGCTESQHIHDRRQHVIVVSDVEERHDLDWPPQIFQTSTCRTAGSPRA